MNAAYLKPEIQLEPGGRTVHAAFDIRNDSLETWRAAQGFGVGYHLFDAETGTLIVDGVRTHPEEVEPGGHAHIHLDFELPAEDGSMKPQ